MELMDISEEIFTELDIVSAETVDTEISGEVTEISEVTETADLDWAVDMEISEVTETVVLDWAVDMEISGDSEDMELWAVDFPILGQTTMEDVKPTFLVL